MSASGRSAAALLARPRAYPNAGRRQRALRSMAIVSMRNYDEAQSERAAGPRWPWYLRPAIMVKIPSDQAKTAIGARMSNRMAPSTSRRMFLQETSLGLASAAALGMVHSAPADEKKDERSDKVV